MNDFEKRWKLHDKDSFDKDVQLLGQLAMNWRGNHIGGYVEEYEKAVDRLINSGRWFEMPPPEDQLPEHLMPQQFYEYWNLERKSSIPERPISFFDSISGVIWVVMAVIIAIWAIVRLSP